VLNYYRFTPEEVVLQELGLAKQGPFRQGWNWYQCFRSSNGVATADILKAAKNLFFLFCFVLFFPISDYHGGKLLGSFLSFPELGVSDLPWREIAKLVLFVSLSQLCFSLQNCHKYCSHILWLSASINLLLVTVWHNYSTELQNSGIFKGGLPPLGPAGAQLAPLGIAPTSVGSALLINYSVPTPVAMELCYISPTMYITL